MPIGEDGRDSVRFYLASILDYSNHPPDLVFN